MSVIENSKLNDSAKTDINALKESAGNIGIKFPEILVPCAEIDRTIWPVIACDQYTSQIDYWKNVENIVGDAPSTLSIILPEIYLEHPGETCVEDRIERINDKMRQFVGEGILTSIGECMVFLDRQTQNATSRLGLVLAIDLESYDFTPGNNNLIRATEGTVLDRIPPRMQIRKDAILETPHVQLLVDDPDFKVHAPLSKLCQEGAFEKLYDLELMSGGGHVKGYRIPLEHDVTKSLIESLHNLSSLTNNGLLFAVGDGNHSLATAKAHWNSIKTGVSSNHPARFALVEIINIHDSGLEFEPIHRVLFSVSFDDFIARASSLLPDAGIIISEKMSVNNAIIMAETIDNNVLPTPVFKGDEAVVFTFINPPSKLCAGAMQILIDKYLETYGGKVDYIHGKDAVIDLSKDNIGMLFPVISKNDFFKLLSTEGVLPRKTFSMGEAFEKRYYLECKLITE